MKNVNVGWNEYFKPTPKNVRKFGDALITISVGLGVVIPGAQWVPVVGLLGKVLTNFFSSK